MALRYGKSSGGIRCCGSLAKEVLSQAPTDGHQGRLEEWVVLSRPQQSTRSHAHSLKDAKQLDLSGEQQGPHMSGVGFTWGFPNNEKLGFYPVGSRRPVNAFFFFFHERYVLGDALVLPGDIYLFFMVKPISSCTDLHRFIAEISWSVSSSLALCTWAPSSLLDLLFFWLC